MNKQSLVFLLNFILAFGYSQRFLYDSLSDEFYMTDTESYARSAKT